MDPFTRRWRWASMVMFMLSMILLKYAREERAWLAFNDN